MIHLYALLLGIVLISIGCGVLYLFDYFDIRLEKILAWFLIVTLSLLMAYLFGASILSGIFGIEELKL